MEINPNISVVIMMPPMPIANPEKKLWKAVKIPTAQAIIINKFGMKCIRYANNFEVNIVFQQFFCCS